MILNYFEPFIADGRTESQIDVTGTPRKVEGRIRIRYSGQQAKIGIKREELSHSSDESQYDFTFCLLQCEFHAV